MMYLLAKKQIDREGVRERVQILFHTLVSATVAMPRIHVQRQARRGRDYEARKFMRLARNHLQCNQAFQLFEGTVAGIIFIEVIIEEEGKGHHHRRGEVRSSSSSLSGLLFSTTLSLLRGEGGVILVVVVSRA